MPSYLLISCQASYRQMAARLLLKLASIWAVLKRSLDLVLDGVRSADRLRVGVRYR